MRIKQLGIWRRSRETKAAKVTPNCRRRLRGGVAKGREGSTPQCRSGRAGSNRFLCIPLQLKVVINPREPRASGREQGEQQSFRPSEHREEPTRTNKAAANAKRTAARARAFHRKRRQRAITKGKAARAPYSKVQFAVAFWPVICTAASTMEGTPVSGY